MSAVRPVSHFHYVTLPSGRKVRSDKESYENDLGDLPYDEIGAGWTIQPDEISRNKGTDNTYRVTTTHVAALNCLLKKNKKSNTRNAKGQYEYNDKIQKALNNATGFKVDIQKVRSDDKYAAIIWANLRNNRELGLNIQRVATMCLPSGVEKFAKKAGEAIGEIAKVALPVAAILVPALAPVLAPLAVAVNVGGTIKDVVDAGKKVKKAVDSVGAVKEIASKVSKAVPSVSKTVKSAAPSVSKTVINKTSPASTVAKTASLAVDKAIKTAKSVSKTTPSVSKTDIKALLQTVSPPVLNQIKQAIKDEKVAKLLEDQKVAKITKATTPVLNTIYRKLQKSDLQKQATSEHLYRNKVNKVIKDNTKNQNTLAKSQISILKKIDDLDKKLLNSAASQRSVAAAFGVPLVYTR